MKASNQRNTRKDSHDDGPIHDVRHEGATSATDKVENQSYEDFMPTPFAKASTKVLAPIGHAPSLPNRPLLSACGRGAGGEGRAGSAVLS